MVTLSRVVFDDNKYSKRKSFDKLEENEDTEYINNVDFRPVLNVGPRRSLPSSFQLSVHPHVSSFHESEETESLPPPWIRRRAKGGDVGGVPGRTGMKHKRQSLKKVIITLVYRPNPSLILRCI